MHENAPKQPHNSNTVAEQLTRDSWSIFENRSMRFARARIGTRPRHSLEQLEPSLRPDIAGEGFPAILIVIEPELVEPESVILMRPWQSVATAFRKTPLMRGIFY
jgi:hypothetical protein